MSLKEHLQFLAMMLPTLLLLGALALSLAFPARSLELAARDAAPAPELVSPGASLDTL